MTFWRKGKKKPEKSALPVTSVDSVEEAELIQAHFCRLSYDGKRYVWPNFSGDVNDLWAVSEKIERHCAMPRNTAS